jgi:hypothetical protein
MPPKTLTAEQVAEIDGKQQKPVNWSAVIPQKEDVLTARVNREAARQDAPAMLTAEQTDAAGAQNSVAAETSFGRAMGARPDRSVGPQVPAPKKVLSAAEVDQADYERVGNISYIPTKDEWKRYSELRQRRDDKVGKFFEAGQAIAGGLVQAAAATAYAPFDFVARGTKAYDEWVNSSAEGMRQASISTAELWSWAGDVYDDNQRELQRNRAMNDQVRQRLAAENRFTGNPQQDEAILEESINQAKAQGLYEKTPQDLNEDEDTQYQRFIRDRSFQQQAANVTETNIGTLPDGRAEMGIDESKLNEGLVLGSALVLDPLNIAIPAGLGAANKVRLLRRVGSLAGTPLKGASKVAGYAAGKAEGWYGKIVDGVESATGLTGSQQMSALSSVSFKAAAAMAALKKSGAVLRATERGLKTGSILAREIGIGGVGASRVEAASKLRSAPIPERYRRAYDGFFTSADSTLRRVSETQGLSPIARRSAATLDKLGATQAFRLADDAVSGAAATAPIAVPLAAIAPEERQPEILGAIMTVGAGAGVIGGKMRRMSEFDGALVAKMLADAEISGGDATSMANMMPHDKLVNMARMQSVISPKADFIPLRATDYEINTTVKEAMGLGTRGIYVDAKKGQRPRIFVNLDKMATGDVAGHEIGHAILKSDILGGEVKRGMRAMVDQQYGTDGVAARGREYVTANLTQEVRDGTTGIQLNVLRPDEVTRIAAAGGDEAAEQALKNEFIRERWANDTDWRKQAIEERADMLNQERLAQGEISWDWARDEIAAETFSGLGNGLNLSGIRASGPLSRAVGAASAGFEAMGARMRGNGRLETPNRLFVENPLFNTPEMRKAVNNYVKTFDRYLVGLEKEGSVKQRGTPIAPTGKAQDAARSPHTRTYSNRGGTVIESDLFIERPDGTRVPKSQQQLDTQEKVRAATIKSINDRTKFVNENSDEWGARKLSNGRVEVGGPTLPLQFDHFVQVPEWLRSKAREFEASRSKGRSYLYSYNAIGTGEAGSYKIKNLGNVEAKTGEMVPFGWAVSTKNHLLAKVIDLNSFRAAAIRAIDNEQLGEFGNDLRAVETGLKQLLSNYENGVAGETGLGVTRKNILNGLLGTGTVVQKASNPVWHTLNNQGSVRTFRFDRLNYADPHGTGYFPHYNKININALPDDAGRMSLDQYGRFDADRKAAWMNKEAVKRGFSNATNWQNADAQGFQAADGQYRQQFPAGDAAQRGSAMPDAATTSKAAKTLEDLKRTSFIPTKVASDVLGGFPEYLKPVAQFIADQRGKLIEGKMNMRDITKAYVMTIASQGSGARAVEVIASNLAKKDIPFAPTQEFLTTDKQGRAAIRPEEAAAYWLGTEAGQRALNNAESGVFNPSDWQEMVALRKAYGDDRFATVRAFSPENIARIPQVLDDINASRGNTDAVLTAVQKLNGISTGKKGFISHLLGIGDVPTIDAVEINFWLTGKGDVGKLNTKRADLVRRVKESVSDKRVSEELFRRIDNRINGLRDQVQGGAEVAPEVWSHVMHHWLWDKAKKIETTHEGMYRAQASFLPDAAPIIENFDAANEATGGRLRSVLDQPENASITGRITPAQEESIRELDEYYRKVTPQRIKELRSDAIESLANRLINKGIPVAEARGLATETYKKIKGRVAGASQVISGMGTSDLSRMAGTGRPAVATRKGVNPNWLTSAFEAFDTDNDLALMKAQQVARQLNKEQQAQVAAGQNVDAARASGVRAATIDQGMKFVIGEKTADQKAFGSSLREDPAAPPRVYASVVEGQKFGSQGNYNVFFEWKKSAPIVTTSHHHYGVGNGLTDIHASANVGDKNARSFGNPETETYDTLPSGKKVLNTRLLVGNAGIDDIRAHQLMVSIPESSLSSLRSAYKTGKIGAVRQELNKTAVSQLVGSASQGKTQSFTSSEGVAPMVAIQRNRTEAYVLNPDLKNVASITIVSNSPKETALIKKNLAKAFENNGSPMPKIKVVSAESGPSGNRGRSKITDEFFNLTGKVVYGAMLGGLAASQTDDNR